MNVHLDDEMLSAALDGYGSVADRAHVDSCDKCRERLDALKRVAELVGSPVAGPDQEAREAAVAAALAVYRGSRVTPAASRRLFVRPVLAAAAVLVLVGIGVVALARSSGNSARKASGTIASGRISAGNSTTTGRATGVPSTTLPAGASGNGSSPVLAPAFQAPVASAPYIGAFTDPGALSVVLRSQLAASERAPAPERAGSPISCAEQAATAAGSPAAPPALVVLLQWRGQEAEAVVYRRDGSHAIGLVVSTPGCQLLTSVGL
jgi:hypothetical protein